VVEPDELARWVAAQRLDQLVTSYLPAGPTADALGQTEMTQVIRPFDAQAWPHATHGFFRFKEKIPQLLTGLGDVTC
jgi:deoxyribodipyrimidine photo-lyase